MASVNSGSAHGSAANPYVISTKEQWVFFANVITNQTAGYTGTAKVWVLGADINLGGNTINAVGRHSTGFQGTLYGNKHSISNGTVAYQSWIDGTSHFAVGLFHKINGGKVFDLSIDSSIKFTMKTNINANVYVHVGGLAAVAYNSTIVNVESNVSFDCRQTGTNNVFCKIGGLVGYVERGGSIIKCLYRGNLHFKGASTAITANDNAHIIGGILGELNSNITIDQCSVNGNVTEESGGPNVGGIVGHVYDTNSFVIKITNITLNVNVKYTGACNSPDIGLICGWFHSQNLNATNGSVISNIYVVGGATYCNSTTPTYYFTTTASNFSDFSKISNISLPVASGTTVYPVWFNESSSAQRKGSTAAVVTEANKNSAITNNFSVSSSGTVTSKLSTFLSTQWADTLPASRVLFTATSTLSLTALSLTNLGYVIPIITQLVCFIISMAVRFTIYLLKVLLN